MLEHLRREYVWQGMGAQVEQYVKNCQTCQETKPLQSKTLGLLDSLPARRKMRDSISVGFITGLPEDGAMDAVLVVVDRFSMMAHFIPTAERISGCQTAELVLHHIWKLHSTPSNIISDCGPQFVSSVWKTLFQCLEIELKLSTAYHP